MTVPAGECSFAQGLKSQGGQGVNKGMLIRDWGAWSSNPSSPQGRKTLLKECFACLFSITGRFWHSLFLCIIKIVADVKHLLKLFKSHFWMTIRGRTQWLCGNCCCCLLYKGVMPCFCGSCEYLFLTGMWYSGATDVLLGMNISFSLFFNDLLSMQCSPCHVHVSSGLWSSKIKCSEVDKLSPLLLVCAFVWDLSTSHSWWLHGMVRGAKALLLKPVFQRFLAYSLCLHLPQHIYTNALCA